MVHDTLSVLLWCSSCRSRSVVLSQNAVLTGSICMGCERSAEVVFTCSSSHLQWHVVVAFDSGWD